MGEKLLPLRAMAIPILLTGASTIVSRYVLNTSYGRYIITVLRKVNTKKDVLGNVVIMRIFFICHLWQKPNSVKYPSTVAHRIY